MTTNTVNEGAPTFATSFTISGIAGNGALTLLKQSSNPSFDVNSVTFFSDSADRLSWIDSTGYKYTFDTTGLTDSRVWALPDSSGTITTNESTSTLANKTILSTGGNIIDATSIKGSTITG